MQTRQSFRQSPKRSSILAAADRMFLACGYSSVTMEAIAEAAPVSKPTLYSHFAGKPALFAAVIERRCAELLEAVARAHGACADVESGLRTVARTYVDLVYSPDVLQLYRLIIAEQAQFPELGRLAYRSGAVPVLAGLAAYLAEADPRGGLRIRDHDRAARFFLGLLMGDEHQRCLLGVQPPPGARARQRLVRDVVALFVRAYRDDG